MWLIRIRWTMKSSTSSKLSIIAKCLTCGVVSGFGVALKIAAFCDAPL